MERRQLDVKGTKCPVPIVRAKKEIDGMHAGDVLEVLATDPGSVRDFEAFCRQTGNQLVESNESADGVFRYLIKKLA